MPSAFIVPRGTPTDNDPATCRACGSARGRPAIEERTGRGRLTPAARDTRLPARRGDRTRDASVTATGGRR